LALFFSVFNIVSVQFISNNIVLALDVVLWAIFHYVFHRIEMRKKANISVSPDTEVTTVLNEDRPSVLREIETENYEYTYNVKYIAPKRLKKLQLDKNP